MVPYMCSYSHLAGMIKKVNTVSSSLIKRVTFNDGDTSHLGQLKHHIFIYEESIDYDQAKNALEKSIAIKVVPLIYRAFCSGNIITEKKVLTSAHCFLTNRKRKKIDLDKVKVAAAVLSTIIKTPLTSEFQQWRHIEKIYSQKYYRFPAFNLAILLMDQPWIFNEFVNKIPIAKWDQDFDGVCTLAAAKATMSWSYNKQLVTKEAHLLQKDVCEQKLLRSCYLYICTTFPHGRLIISKESEGSGLICHGTGDPAETDDNGVLVAITSLINVEIPSLHSRAGLFNKWIADNSPKAMLENRLVAFYCIFIFFIF